MNVPAGLSTEMCDMVIQTLRQVVGRELPDDRIMELDEKDQFPEDLIHKLLSPDVGLHLKGRRIHFPPAHMDNFSSFENALLLM